MLDRLPKPVELGIFILLALLCAVIVTISPHRDTALFFAGAPLFFVCAMLGSRRSLSRVRAEKGRVAKRRVTRKAC